MQFQILPGVETPGYYHLSRWDNQDWLRVVQKNPPG